jgi:hypothetical protein
MDKIEALDFAQIFPYKKVLPAKYSRNWMALTPYALLPVHPILAGHRQFFLRLRVTALRQAQGDKALLILS